MTSKPETAPTAAYELVLRRKFDAPRELVWKAFTQAEHVAQWFGPKGFTTRVEELDLRVGGKTRYVMVGPDGTEYPAQGVFLEIVPGERFVSTDEFGEDHPGDTFGGMVVTAIFADKNGATELTLRISHQSAEDRQKHEQMGVLVGWHSSFDCLSELLTAWQNQNTADREMVISRLFDATPEQVFDVWTDTQHASAWFGPQGFTTTTHHADIRPGGSWKFTMHGPDGVDYENHIIYLQVQRPTEIIYRHVNVEDATVDVQFNTTVTFEAVEGRTKVTLHSRFDMAEDLELVKRDYHAEEGGHQTLARLAAHVSQKSGVPLHKLTVSTPGDCEIRMTRLFDARRPLVFETFTKPEHIRRWWGCGTFEMTVCEMDFRPGGAWHFVQTSPDGQVHPFRGEYREIVAPERIVQTFIYDVEMIRDHASVETLTLTDLGTQTLMTIHVMHDSQISRDAHLNSGMESGASTSFNRMAELLKTLG